jgi:hypothetical protein
MALPVPWMRGPMDRKEDVRDRRRIPRFTLGLEVPVCLDQTGNASRK